MAKSKATPTDGKKDGTPDAAATPYVVLARKYRPATFDDLIGQEAMVTTLRNAFATGRIAQGYMLTGVRGVGKTTTARILARALNYERDGVNGPTVDMPEFGRHCAEIIESRHPDVLEMDAASNTGVDNIREIIESARYKPMSARTKVYIIDEVHMLSKGAFNALLKTLEEPPEHVKFIFATTEIRKVPVTVLSRCQRFDLRRVDVPALTKHFDMIANKEGATAAPEALALIARAAEGSVRDGLSLLDQAIAISSGGAGTGNVTSASVREMLGLADRGRIFDLLDKLFAGEAGDALAAFGGLNRDGADPIQILSDLAEAVHTTTRAKVAGADGAGDGLTGEERKRAATLAGQLSPGILSRAWQMLLKGIEEATRAPNATAAAEMVLIRLAYTADLPAPDELIRTLGGAPVRAPGAAADAPRGSPSRGPLNQAPAPEPRAERAGTTPSPQAPNFEDMQPVGELPDIDAPEYEDEHVPMAGAAGMPVVPRTFLDVIQLVGLKRAAKLKVHLEEHVSLVKFDPAGQIELHLLAGAPNELGNELREKLNAWTGKKWMIALSRQMGETPVGVAERARIAAEIEQLKQHPAIAAVLKEFPDAEITSLKAMTTLPEDETGTG